jgi:23S rRNA G2069 N7-methylase RlmK/C1962 C5-methylase RlmI
MLTRSVKAPGKGAHTWMTKATTKAAVLTERGAARAQVGDPWIYRSDIADAAGVADNVARLVDRGTFLGSRLLQPGSEISLWIFSREDEALGGAWLRNRIERAKTTANPSA